MTENASPRSQTPATPMPGRYRLEPGSCTIQTSTRAMFGLFAVKGTFQIRDGEVTIAEDPAACVVRVTIDASSYDSGNVKRDQDVRSPALLDADRYPDITFAATGARPDGDGWVVDGTVGAHGTTDTISVRVSEARVDGDGGSFHATAQLDRTRLGVTGKKGMVGTTVTLTIDARATKI